MDRENEFCNGQLQMQAMKASRFKRICVFCGSSPGKNPSFQLAALQLANQLVERKIDLVYGGGSIGLMGLVSRAVYNGGRHVLGVIPKTLMPKEYDRICFVSGLQVGAVPDIRDLAPCRSFPYSTLTGQNDILYLLRSALSLDIIAEISATCADRKGDRLDFAFPGKTGLPISCSVLRFTLSIDVHVLHDVQIRHPALHVSTLSDGYWPSHLPCLPDAQISPLPLLFVFFPVYCESLSASLPSIGWIDCIIWSQFLNKWCCYCIKRDTQSYLLQLWFPQIWIIDVLVCFTLQLLYHPLVRLLGLLCIDFGASKCLSSTFYWVLFGCIFYLWGFGFYYAPAANLFLIHLLPTCSVWRASDAQRCSYIPLVFEGLILDCLRARYCVAIFRIWRNHLSCSHWPLYNSVLKMRTKGFSIHVMITCSGCSVFSLELSSARFNYHPCPISPMNPDEFAAGWHAWHINLILLCCLRIQSHIAHNRYCMNCWLCSVIWTCVQGKLYVHVPNMQLDHCSLATLTWSFMFGYFTELNSLSSVLCLKLDSLWTYLFYGTRVCWRHDMSSAYENLCMLLHRCIFGIYRMYLLSLVFCLIRGNVEVPSRNFPRPSRLRHKNHPSRFRYGVCMSYVSPILLLFSYRTKSPLSLHSWLWLPFYHLLRQVMDCLDVIIVVAFNEKQLPGHAKSILLEFIIVGSRWFLYVLLYEFIAVWTEIPEAFWLLNVFTFFSVALPPLFCRIGCSSLAENFLSKNELLSRYQLWVRLSYAQTELGWREEHSLQIISGRRSILQLAFVLMRNCQLFYWMEDLSLLLCCKIFCVSGLMSLIWLLLCLASEDRRGCISFRNSKALFQTAFGLRLQLLWLRFFCLVFSAESSPSKIFLR